MGQIWPEISGHDQENPDHLEIWCAACLAARRLARRKRPAAFGCNQEKARNGQTVSPSDGLPLSCLRRCRLHRAGVDFSSYPMGGIYPLRAQQRGVVARAARGSPDHRADLHRRGRRLPAQPAHERFLLRRPVAGQAPRPARSRRPIADGADRDLHDRVGRPARRGDLVQYDRGFSFPVGRRHLSADSGRRGLPPALHCRADFPRGAVRSAVSQLRSCAIRLTRDRQSMDILILLTTMLVCFLIGMPIAYSLALAAIAGAWSIGIPLEAVMLKISDGVSKVAMLTIPFFVLAGAIMAEGGMARRLVAFADVLVGFTRLRGGLSIVNVLATTFLSGISGSAVADTSAIGSVMIPQMEKTGYPRVFATNLTITSSVQALLVPPSHNAVLYSLATGGTISISALFMAGVFPGLLLGFSLIILCLAIAYRDKHPHGQTVAAKDALKITIDAAWGMVTLVIILGGILGGIFTAIEAGAVACIWAFFVTMFIYRDYRWRDLPVLLHRTLRTVAMVLTLIACASSVGYIMALTQMPAKMTAFFLSISDNKYVILFLINILLLVLGTLVDMAPSILIATPILLPVMQNFGVDPVHFGMIMLLNLGIGLCHPPVGAILFVGCAVGKVTIEQVVREIWPFYAVMFFVLMLITYIPAISLWLPRMLSLQP